MKNFMYLMVAFMLAVTACDETEVAVDDVTTDVKFKVTTENVVLKSETETAPFFIGRIEIDGYRAGGKHGTHQIYFDEDGIKPGEISVWKDLMLGQWKFAAHNPMDNNVQLCEAGNYKANENTVMIAGKTSEEIATDLRKINPWMHYTCEADVLLTADFDETIDMPMETEYGRLIVTVEFADPNLDYFAKVLFKNNDDTNGFMKTGSANLDPKRNVAYFYWSNEHCKAGQELNLDIFINERGGDNGAPLKEWLNFTDEKLKVEGGVDRWVKIVIGDDPSIFRNDVPFSVTFDYELQDDEINL